MNFKSFLSTSFAVRVSADHQLMSAKINQYEVRSQS